MAHYELARPSAGIMRAGKKLPVAIGLLIAVAASCALWSVILRGLSLL